MDVNNLEKDAVIFGVYAMKMGHVCSHNGLKMVAVYLLIFNPF